jgi:hypothetical protein
MLAPSPGVSRHTQAALRESERVRLRRIRRDARRPLAVNLAEGLALSELVGRFTGAALRR